MSEGVDEQLDGEGDGEEEVERVDEAQESAGGAVAAGGLVDQLGLNDGAAEVLECGNRAARAWQVHQSSHSPNLVERALTPMISRDMIPWTTLDS